MKRTALHNHLFADSGGISQFDYLKEGVFNHRIRKPRRNIADGRAFLLRLFNTAVHKDRTAASEINGLWREERLHGKVRNWHTERAGKVIQKTAAARRTSFVELNGADTVILHADALHILSADVE